MAFTPPPDAVQNEYGFWVQPDGALVPGQDTPGSLATPQAKTYYDADKDLDYRIVNGKREYQSPVSYDTSHVTDAQRLAGTGGGDVVYNTTKSGAPMSDRGGGLIHGSPKWNAEKGKWDIPIDWGKALSWGVAGGMGGGALAAGLAGGAGAAGAASSGSLLPSTTLAGSSVLGGSGLTSAGIAGGAGILGTAGTVAGAAGAGAAGAAGGVLPSTTIGTGSIGPITGGASGSGMGGGGMGWIDTAKQLYDGYNKAKGIYDEGKGAYDSIYGDAAAAAGGAAAGRAQGRIDEAAIQQKQDQLALQRGQLGVSAADLELAQRKYGLAAPGQRAGNAVRGDILARAQDVSFGGLGPNVHVPTISGGLRPSMFSDATRQLGATMPAQALQQQQAGDTFAPLAIPDLTTLPQAGKVDSILNTAGAVGTGVDLFQQWLANRKPKPPAPPTDATAAGWQGEDSGMNG